MTRRGRGGGGLAAAAALALALLAPSAAAEGPRPVQVANLGGGFLEFLFGGRGRPPAAPAPTPVSIAPPPMQLAPPARGPAAPGTTVAPTGGGFTYCVRVCDGFAFPLGRLASRRDVPLHRDACAAACPGAPTRLYLGSRDGGFAATRAIDDGSPYSALPTALRHRRERVEGCSCQGPRSADALLRDATLRRGDVIVTREGALVFDGSGGLDDFRASPAATAALRGRIDAALGVSARAAIMERWRAENPNARERPRRPDERAEAPSRTADVVVASAGSE